MGGLNFKTMELKKRIDVIYWALGGSIFLHCLVLFFCLFTKPAPQGEEKRTYVLSSILNAKAKGENIKSNALMKSSSHKELLSSEGTIIQAEDSISQSVHSAGHVTTEEFNKFFIEVRSLVELEISKTKSQRPQTRGDLVVLLTIEPSGSIGKVELEQSSGSQKLDRYVISTIEKMSSLEHIPETLQNEKIVFKIPLSFKTI